MSPISINATTFYQVNHIPTGGFLEPLQTHWIIWQFCWSFALHQSANLIWCYNPKSKQNASLSFIQYFGSFILCPSGYNRLMLELFVDVTVLQNGIATDVGIWLFHIK